MSTHVPVLLNEVSEILNPQPGEFFIDGTLGDGGHAAKILEKIGKKGKLLGIDWDKEAILKQKNRFKKFRNVNLIKGNYAYLPEILGENKLGKADGLILDLGFSSGQLENSGRGFSFLKNEPLDMRYDFSNASRMKTNESRITAAEVVNSFKKDELENIIRTYGGERYARRIASQIVQERKIKRIITTFDLSEIIKKAAPKNYEHHRINPATRTFLALRIFINEELDNLKKVLENLQKILKVGGRVAIISFNSLEDRIVKQNFRETQKSGLLRTITKKPIRPTLDEISENPRSRSAKLRAAIVNGLV